MQPFITISEGGNTSDSSGSASEPSDEETPLSTPPSVAATHDTSRAGFHKRDLESFARDLQNAADRAFPNTNAHKPRYRDVSVLLLRWEDDEMNVDWELDDLDKVFMNYGFNTEQWLIPKKNPHIKLMSKVIDLVEEHDGREDLVIVYYAGHAYINASRQATWCCKSDPTYASLEWSAIQTLFEKADLDVLLLLDCCAAASAAPTVGSAVTETIAACGFESIAPQPGRCSFTNTLIEVLEDWINSPPFSAAMLHNKVLSVLKHERPERIQSGKRRKMECRRTPIHIVATANPRLPSIELGRRTAIAEVTTTNETPSTATEKTHNAGEGLGSPPKGQEYHPTSLNDLTGNEYKVPRVIISLALDENQNLGSKMCQEWLASCPTLVKFATVEAVFKSYSTLVLLSIPVLIWDLLPEDPACVFVGYATSPNMLGHDASLTLGRSIEGMHAVVAPRNREKLRLLDVIPPDPPSLHPLAGGHDPQNSVEGQFRSNSPAYCKALLQKPGSTNYFKHEELSPLPSPPNHEFQSFVHDKFQSNSQSYDSSLLQKLDARPEKTLDNFGLAPLDPQIRNASIKDSTTVFRPNSTFSMSPLSFVFDSGAKVLWNMSEETSVLASISQKQSAMKMIIREYLENYHAWAPGYLDEIILENENINRQIEEILTGKERGSLDQDLRTLQQEQIAIQLMISQLARKYEPQAPILQARSYTHKQGLFENPADGRDGSSQEHDRGDFAQGVTMGQHQGAEQNTEAQNTFRKRKEHYLRELEAKVAKLEGIIESSPQLGLEMASLKFEMQKLASENETLKHICSDPSLLQSMHALLVSQRESRCAKYPALKYESDEDVKMGDNEIQSKDVKVKLEPDISSKRMGQSMPQEMIWEDGRQKICSIFDEEARGRMLNDELPKTNIFRIPTPDSFKKAMMPRPPNSTVESDNLALLFQSVDGGYEFFENLLRDAKNEDHSEGLQQDPASESGAKNESKSSKMVPRPDTDMFPKKCGWCLLTINSIEDAVLHLETEMYGCSNKANGLLPSNLSRVEREQASTPLSTNTEHDLRTNSEGALRQNMEQNHSNKKEIPEVTSPVQRKRKEFASSFSSRIKEAERKRRVLDGLGQLSKDSIQPLKPHFEGPTSFQMPEPEHTEGQFRHGVDSRYEEEKIPWEAPPPVDIMALLKSLPPDTGSNNQTAVNAPHPPAEAPTYPYVTSSTCSSSSDANEDWTKIADLAERRRIQNRIAQRNYRQRLRRRLEDLERRASAPDGDQRGEHEGNQEPNDHGMSTTTKAAPHIIKPTRLFEPSPSES